MRKHFPDSSVARKVPEAKAHRKFEPELVTLASYHNHFGRVVTFEGVVVSIVSSRKGTAFAAMFERRKWTKGLKLVFFERVLVKVGGATFVQSLDGRRVRVRGLMSNNERFGPQIIISERAMILSVI